MPVKTRASSSFARSARRGPRWPASGTAARPTRQGAPTSRRRVDVGDPRSRAAPRASTPRARDAGRAPCSPTRGGARKARLEGGGGRRPESALAPRSVNIARPPPRPRERRRCPWRANDLQCAMTLGLEALAEESPGTSSPTRRRNTPRRAPRCATRPPGSPRTHRGRREREGVSLPGARAPAPRHDVEHGVAEHGDAGHERDRRRRRHETRQSRVSDHEVAVHPHARTRSVDGRTR